MQKGKQGGLTISQIHFLHHQTDEILDDLQNRVGSSAFWADEHIEDLKSNEETFDFTMRADIPASAHATKKNRVVIPDADGNLREFIIYEVIQDNHMEKEVYTIASYTELEKQRKPIPPQELESQTVNMAVDWTLAGTEWERGITEYAGIRKVTIDNYTNPLKLLKQLATLFGLELRFRVVRDRNRIVGRYVDMVRKRGEDTKKETVLGKDLVGIQRREATDIVTALLVVGPEREDGERLTAEVVDEEAFQRWGRNGNHLWALYEPETENEEITLSRLIHLGRTQLDKMINTIVQYSATSVGLEENFNLSHEKVRIGDVNRVKDTSFVPPLYMEARIIKVTRSISDTSKRSYVLGDFIEYSEDDILKTFRQLQVLYGAKVIRSDTPPPNPKQGMIWVDTSGKLDVIYTWNAATKQWEKAVPSHAEEVGAYDKETVDQKDQSVYDDSTWYTDIVSEEKKQEAINHTNTEVQKRELAIIRQDTEPTGSNYVVGQLWLRTTDDAYFKWTGNAWKQLTPSLAEVGAKAGLDYVNGELNAKASIEALASKADLEYVDGQLVSKANKAETYTISEVDNALDSKVSILTYTTDQNGVVQRLESAESRITQSETEITSKVSNTVYLADKNNLQGQIDEKANQTTVNGISSRLTTAESTITQQADEIASKVNQTTYDTDRNGIVTRLDTAESTLTQHASQIASKVSQTDFNSLSGRVSTAESSITQQAGLIEQRVTKTEFENLSFGGRNLMLDSKVQANTTSYLVRQYILSEDFITGQQYTFVIKGSVPDGQRFGIWQNGGNTSRGYATEIYSDGVTYITFTAAATTAGNERRLSLYNFPSNTTRATVEWVALYKGNKPFDWTPAPEDVDGAISGLGSRISTAESSITQQANAINLRVKTEDYTIDQNALKSRVSTAESTITQHANAISLRVEKDGVISSINQSPESIRIAASKIHIDGNVTFSNGYNPLEKETPAGALSKANAALNSAIEYTNQSTGNLVDNPTAGKGLGRWSASGLSVVNHTFDGVSVPVLQSSVSTDTQNYSGWFDVDPSKAYEVSVWFKKSASTGITYLGLNGASGANGGGSSVGFVDVRSSTGGIANANNTNFYFFNHGSGSSPTDWVKVVGYIMPAGTNSSDLVGVGDFPPISGGSYNNNAIMKPNHRSIRIRFLNWSNSGTTRQLWVANPKVQEVDPLSVLRAAKSKRYVDEWAWGDTTEINGGKIRTKTLVANHIASLNGLNVGNGQFQVDNSGNVTMRGHLDGATGTFSGAVVGGSFERTSTSAGNRTIINENGIFVQFINSSATTVEQVSLQGNSVAWLNNTGTSILGTIRYSVNSLRINSSIVGIDGNLMTDQINTSDYLWVRRSSVSSAAFFTNRSTGRIAEFRSGAGDGSVRSYIDNDGTLATNRILGVANPNVVAIGNTGIDFDNAGGAMRLRINASNYIMISSSGEIRFIQDGLERHTFRTNGTKQGGSIVVDNVNLGMSPVDSPQYLLEYIQFNIPLSTNGTTVYIDSTYLKTVENFAVFPNNGQIVEKGKDYFIIKGTGVADCRIVGERIGYAGKFYEVMNKVQAA